MLIYLVVWDKESFHLSQSLFHNVQAYIDDHYIDEHRYCHRGMFSVPGNCRGYVERDRNDLCRHRASSREETVLPPCDAVIPENTETDRHAAEDIPCAKAVSSCSTAAVSSLPSLDDLLANTDAGFTETLLKLIDQSGKKDSEVYKKANVSKQHFSKIRNNLNYKPTKATALAFAIALELDLVQTEDLIGRAGYALTRSSKFDVIIMYFIIRKNYDMFQINMTLFEFDQMTLGV